MSSTWILSVALATALATSTAMAEPSEAEKRTVAEAISRCIGVGLASLTAATCLNLVTTPATS
jgi:hypothetical protein